MSDAVFEGKTVEEAVEAACRELGLSRDRLQIEVLSTGSTGVFGLGVKKAKVRVSVPEPQPEPSGKTGPRVAPDEVLKQIISLLGFDLAVESSHENDAQVLNLHGKDAGLLIGKQGQTIDALQYLLNKMLSKDAGEKMQVVLDCEGYRDKRKAFLTDVAARLKERVQKTGKSSYTDMLNAADRRIIHVTLQNDPLVRTKSIGDGFLKKVVVYARAQEGAPDKSQQ